MNDAHNQIFEHGLIFLKHSCGSCIMYLTFFAQISKLIIKYSLYISVYNASKGQFLLIQMFKKSLTFLFITLHQL